MIEGLRKGVGELPTMVAVILATAWVGGMWVVGYLVVPTLFHALPDNRMLAGALAGQLFAGVAYLGLGCGVYWLMYGGWRWKMSLFSRLEGRLLLAMLLLVLVGQFALQPQLAALKALAWPQDVMHSAQAGRFGMLHGVSSLLYLLQSALGGWWLWRVHAIR